jgi:hypothetical protein
VNGGEKKGTATEVIKEQAKVLGQQMDVTNSVCKNWCVFYEDGCLLGCCAMYSGRY